MQNTKFNYLSQVNNFKKELIPQTSAIKKAAEPT